jgi:hypothetical protein
VIPLLIGGEERRSRMKPTCNKKIYIPNLLHSVYIKYLTEKIYTRQKIYINIKK